MKRLLLLAAFRALRLGAEKAEKSRRFPFRTMACGLRCRAFVSLDTDQYGKRPNEKG